MDLRSNLDYYSVDTMNNSLEDDKDSKDGNSKKPRIAHSEVEKRRREKMNKYLFDLVPYLPQNLINKNKKLDKITILKLSVQHMKYLKDSNLSQPKNNNHKKNIYTNNELESLMFNSNELTNGFLFVIKCDTNKIIYATDSCFKCIGHNSNELIDKVFYDLIHPSDIKYTKEQLSYTDLINSINTANNFMLEKTTNNLPGSRRSFVCRVQKGGGSRSSNSSTNNDDHHQLVHFVGYIRCECLQANLLTANRPNELLLNEMLLTHQQSTSTSSVSSPSSSSIGAADHSNNNKIHPIHPFVTADFGGFTFPQLLEYSLILHGQIKHQVLPAQDEFLTKYDLDGKIVYVEPSVYAVFGYLEHELLGNSLKEYVHPEDLNSLLNKIKEAINTKEKVKTQGYRFRLKNFDYAAVESSLYALQNPFNNKIECIISSNKKI